MTPFQIAIEQCRLAASRMTEDEFKAIRKANCDPILSRVTVGQAFSPHDIGLPAPIHMRVRMAEKLVKTGYLMKIKRLRKTDVQMYRRVK